jgi:hypothetical protein
MRGDSSARDSMRRARYGISRGGGSRGSTIARRGIGALHGRHEFRPSVVPSTPNVPPHLRASWKRRDARMRRGLPEDGTARGLPFRCSATLGRRSGRRAAVWQELRQSLWSQHDVARHNLAVSLTETHQLVRDRSHSHPIRGDKLSSLLPRLFHSGFGGASTGHRRLHQTQNISGSGKVSIIRKGELSYRKAGRWREQRHCSIACHNNHELRPEPLVVGNLGEFRPSEPSAAMPKAIDGIDPQFNTFEGNTQMHGSDCVPAFMDGRSLDGVVSHNRRCAEGRGRPNDLPAVASSAAGVATRCCRDHLSCTRAFPARLAAERPISPAGVVEAGRTSTAPTLSRSWKLAWFARQAQRHVRWLHWHPEATRRLKAAMPRVERPHRAKVCEGRE